MFSGGIEVEHWLKWVKDTCCFILFLVDVLILQPLKNTTQTNASSCLQGV